MRPVKTLAQRFKYAREAAGLTKADLARALGISRASVTQIESGITKNLRGSTLVSLEQVTGISSEWVEEGRGSPRKRPGPLPVGAEDQVAKIYEAFIRLPPEHRARVEAEIDFLLSLNKDE